MATPVTPVAALTSVVSVGNTPVTPIPANPNGGFITNPLSASESLFVNPVIAATLTPQNTTFELVPGATWNVVPGQTTVTSVNAATGGHHFSAIYW